MASSAFHKAEAEQWLSDAEILTSQLREQAVRYEDQAESWDQVRREQIFALVHAILATVK